MNGGTVIIPDGPVIVGTPDDGTLLEALRLADGELHARPEVRDILIAHKMRYWSLRAQYPTAFPNCSGARARRNLLRLLAKYPQIGKRLGLTVLSAYPPL